MAQSGKSKSTGFPNGQRRKVADPNSNGKLRRVAPKATRRSTLTDASSKWLDDYTEEEVNKHSNVTKEQVGQQSRW